MLNDISATSVYIPIVTPAPHLPGDPPRPADMSNPAPYQIFAFVFRQGA